MTAPGGSQVTPASRSGQMFRQQIGTGLREVRHRQNRSTTDVAARAYISRSYLYEVESGIKEVSSEVLDAICKALDVEIMVTFPTVSEAKECLLCSD